MAERKPLFLNTDGADQGYHEEMAVTDTLQLGGLTMGGNIAMGGYAITNLSGPTDGTDAANKQYVDDVAAGLSWEQPVTVRDMVSDADQSGAPPVGPADGDSYVVNNWGAGYTDGDIVEWSGSAWVVIVDEGGTGEPPDDIRVLVKETGAAGSFAGKGGEVGTYDAGGDTWSFSSPADGAAILVNGDGSINENNGYTYTGSTWTQFTGAGAITAGSGLDKLGNSMFIDYGDGLHDDGAGKAAVHLGTDPGLEFVTGELEVKLDGTTLQKLTAGMSVKGVPSQFEIGGVAVSANVTGANMDTLAGGAASDASALHFHKKIKITVDAFEAIALADPVFQSATASQVGKARADTDAKSYVLGLAEAAQATPGSSLPMVPNGSLAEGVLVGATPGARYWLQSTGGIGTSVPGAGKRFIQIGFAKTATDLWVDIKDYGKKAA